MLFVLLTCLDVMSESSEEKDRESSDSDELTSLSDSSPPLAESKEATPGSPQDGGEGARCVRQRDHRGQVD